MLIRRLMLAAIAGAASIGVAHAQAPAFPSRPITLVVPFPAGGPSDIFGRLLAKGMSERLGQPVVIENKSGAGGVIGMDFVAKAQADGHVIGLASPSAIVLNPQLLSKMPYDARKDLAPLTLVSRVQEVIGTHPDLGVSTAKELAAKAKAAPGKITYGSAGTGGITHLAALLFDRETGVETTHVPYRGAAPAVTDLLSGQVNYVILDITVLLPHIRSGKIKPVMITSDTRAKLLPDVQSAVDAGIPKVNSDNWYALFTGAGVPAAARARLAAAAVETLRTPELVEEYAKLGALSDPTTPEGLAKHIEDEWAKWGAIIKAANIKLD